MRKKNVAVASAIALGAMSAAFEVTALAAPRVKVERAEASSLYNSDPVKVAIATCDRGQVALGSWATIDGGDGQVMLKAVYPQAQDGAQAHRPDSAIAIAAEQPAGTDASWRVRAYAFCASDLPYDSTDWVKVSTTANSDSRKTATAECRDDKVVVGTGAAVFSGGGAAYLTGFFPDGSTKVTARASASPSFAQDWDLAAYATCADRSVFDALTVSLGYKVSDGEEAFVYADCPTDGSVISGGGAIVGLGRGEVYLISVLGLPELASYTTLAAAQTKEGDLPWYWWVRTYAICAANVEW